MGVKWGSLSYIYKVEDRFMVRREKFRAFEIVKKIIQQLKKYIKE
jgi:hypothetical protein